MLPRLLPRGRFGENAVFRTATKPLKNFGDPGWIRTSDPQLRRLVLYPAELRGLAWRKVYPRRRPIERCAAGFAQLTWTAARPRDERHCRTDLRRTDVGLPARRALAARRGARLPG